MIYEVLFIIAALLYSIMSVKIDYWSTISILGFSTETPELFIRKPKSYELLRSILFISSVAASLMLSAFPWYLGIIFIACLWLSSGAIGRSKAFSKYREIMNDMIDYAETEEEKTTYQNELKKTNQELLDKTMKRLNI